jgi:LmbE family N-acetylglucosaminyl deacetylase
MLMVFAHPDDESFGMGGTIARYVASGVEVTYFCATSGEVGSIPDDMKDLFPTVKELRLSELEAAAKCLGFKVILGNYCDSGMMNSEHNLNPESLWYQWQHYPAKVVRHLVDVIRQTQPQVIVTFNKYGGYGHPDHIAIQQATLQAFDKAADPAYVTDDPPYKPQKLYYTSIPALFLKLMVRVMKLRGQDVRHMGTNKDLDFQAVIDNIEPTHTKVDIRDYLYAWDEANQCHKSQGGGMNQMFPMWLRRRVMGTQGFTRVIPAPKRDAVDEYDLFNGVQPEPVRKAAPVHD